MMKIQTNFKSGFTLVETFVAITILLIAIIGPLGILAKSFSDAEFAKNQVTATHLAREGVELVVAKRDYNLYTNKPPFDGLGECYVDSIDSSEEDEGDDEDSGCYSNSYILNDLKNSFSACIGERCRMKTRSGTNDFAMSYYFAASTDNPNNPYSPFYRVTRIKSPTSGDFAVEVEVVVYWFQRSGFGESVRKEVKMSTYIYDQVY